MEVVGALASSLQIVGQCGKATFTIISWIESVKTVDDRIDAFVFEIGTLRTTYETLDRSLKEPTMMEAARITNRDVGGHLWAQMSQTLSDCVKTMNRINVVLQGIQESSGIFRPVIKQLKESLKGGELARLREQVVMFNTSLQLPMQMITLTIQLRQAETSATNQVQLNNQLGSLRRAIHALDLMCGNLVRRPTRQPTLGGSTAVGDSMEDKFWFDNMGTYVYTAKKFLDTASVAASARSAPSTQYPTENDATTLLQRRGSNFVPLTNQNLERINMYVQDLPTENSPPPRIINDAGPFADYMVETPVESDAQSVGRLNDASDSDDDDDNTYLPVLQALLNNGHSSYESSKFDLAEENYRAALTMSQANSFELRIACSTSDITLLLAECLVKQEKYDEACTLLLPLAEQLLRRKSPAQSNTASIMSGQSRATEKGQALSACHLLAVAYLKKGDLVHAEQYSMQAFKGRRNMMGESHQKTIESVNLVIDMHRAKGENAMADAFKVHLKPVKTSHDPFRSPSATILPETPPSTLQGRVMPVEVAPKTRRPTFNITSPFRRHERNDSNPTAYFPQRSPPNIDELATREPEQLNLVSTSPRNFASGAAIDRQPANVRNSRQEGSVSTSSSGHIRPWATQESIPDRASTSQRASSVVSNQQSPVVSPSLSPGAPALYANMSQTELEQKFQEVAKLCQDNKASKAVKKGIAILQRYDARSSIFIHRADELQKSIEKSKGLGLAGTGYGYAPIHFFCSLGFEPIAEVSNLLRAGADANAVAYKAGYHQAKKDPATPLTMAIERGHVQLARVLLQYGASWNGNSANPEPNPLLSALTRGHTRIVEDLLTYGMTLREIQFPRTWHGNSLLHEASFRCDLAMVECLLSQEQNSEGYSFIGRPGQQDAFGVTALMYAVDMSEHKLHEHKRRHRIDCLKILLGTTGNPQLQETDNGEIMVDLPDMRTDRSAMDLHMQDDKGNTIYWYADKARGGDAELKAFLDDQNRRSRLIDF